MREKRTVQSSIFHFFADHEIGRELQAISNWLDSHPEILELVAADLQEVKVRIAAAKDCQWNQCYAVQFSSNTGK